MTAAAIIRDSTAAGVTLSLSAAGTIKAMGEQGVVTRWLAAIRENKAGIVALLSEEANHEPFVASCWAIHFGDRSPMEVAFSPPANHDEVLASYPNALAAEPIEPGRRQPEALLTGRQEAIIRAWLVQVGETDEAIVDDVLAQCRRDEDARHYFLGRASECATDDTDDRRRCYQCQNLQHGVCVIAEPGGLVSAIRGYRPVTEVLRRCDGYVPNANDNDQEAEGER